MGDMPERIWAIQTQTNGVGEWRQENEFLKAQRAFEYIRADKVAELQAENERLKRATDPRLIHDRVKGAVMGMLSMWDVEEMPSADMLRATKDGAVGRYMSDIRFHNKVDALTSAIVMDLTSEEPYFGVHDNSLTQQENKNG